MKNSIFLLIVILLASCTSNTIFKKPKDLISKDSMVLLLSDLFIATSSKFYENKYDERNIDYTFLVYEKYGIDSARFKRSNYYYTTKIDVYEKIYKEVESKLELLNKEFKTEKRIKDSIRRDSLKSIKKKRNQAPKKDTMKEQES
jgi:uncharacterized protein YcfL